MPLESRLMPGGLTVNRSVFNGNVRRKRRLMLMVRRPYIFIVDSFANGGPCQSRYVLGRPHPLLDEDTLQVVESVPSRSGYRILVTV